MRREFEKGDFPDSFEKNDCASLFFLLKQNFLRATSSFSLTQGANTWKQILWIRIHDWNRPQLQCDFSEGPLALATWLNHFI